VAAVRIRQVESFEDLQLASRLLDEIWGAATPILPMRVLRALHHAGAIVTVAEDDEGPLGASVAFHGIRDGERLLHSKVTGLKSRGRGAGVAAAMKLDQRRRALDLGIELIDWTFDPLVMRNAAFNLNKLGGVISAYEPDFYGPLDDDLNRGEASDRCVVDWRLNDDRVTTAIAHLDAGTRRDVDVSDAVRVLEANADGLPVRQEITGAEPILAVGPTDIEALRRADPAAASAWRQAMRATLCDRVGAGWRVVAVVNGAYLALPPD